LPYIEQQGLYNQIRLDEPWDSEHNRQFHSEAPRIFQCPSGNSRSSPRESVPVPVPSGSYYSIVYGAETPFYGSQPKTIGEITGGLSNTIFLVERRIPVNWMDPSREITFAMTVNETAIKSINVDAMGISSYHPGGVNIALGDGSVRFVADTIDNETLRKILMFEATSMPLQ
jgi:prepilin-type processing-associated H-X9-DG protein